MYMCMCVCVCSPELQEGANTLLSESKKFEKTSKHINLQV